MKTLFLLTLLILSAPSWSVCFKDPEKHVAEISHGGESFSYKFVEHQIFIPKDSCGAKGCEILVFSPAPEGCFKISLNIKGHFLPQTLKENHIGVSIDGKIKRFRYDLLEKRFK